MDSFLLTLLLGGLFISIIVAILGSLIVFTRSASLTGAVSHANFGAVGLAFYFQLNSEIIPFWIALFSGVIGGVLGVILLKFPDRKESLIQSLWAVGMSVGVLFLYLGNVQNGEVISYLFGNFLFLNQFQLKLLGGLALLLLLLSPFIKIILGISYDPDFLQLRKVRTGLLYTLFLIVVSIVIGLLVQIVGIILLLALFTLPPVIIEQIGHRPLPIIVGSGVLTFGVISGAILLSLIYPIPLIPTIVLILALLLLLTSLSIPLIERRSS